MSHEKLENNAVLIQLAYRRYIIRVKSSADKDVGTLKNQNSEHEDRCLTFGSNFIAEPERLDSSTESNYSPGTNSYVSRIQALWRGHRARSIVSTYQRRLISLQRAWRSRLSRNRNRRTNPVTEQTTENIETGPEVSDNSTTSAVLRLQHFFRMQSARRTLLEMYNRVKRNRSFMMGG